MRLHPHRGWYQEAPPRGALCITQRRCRPEGRRVVRQARFSNASDGNGFRRTSASMRTWNSNTCLLSMLSVFRADVRHAGTAEPKRVHGQRPWFQSVMTNGEGRRFAIWSFGFRHSFGFRVSEFVIVPRVSEFVISSSPSDPRGQVVH